MVSYPQGDTLRKVISGFEATSGLPNCVGAIDWMHLRMKQLAGHHGSECLNQDRIHTIVTQTAVDSSTRVLSLATGFTGVVHKLEVLLLSSLYENIQSGRFLNTPAVDIQGIAISSYLVRGPSYQLKPWLMVPYPGIELDAHEDSFNSSLSQAWQAVDKTFLALERWRTLSSVMQVDVPTAVHMIGAIWIIYNMLLDTLCPADRQMGEEDFMLDTKLTSSPHVDKSFVADTLVAHSTRDALATNLITM